MSDLKNIYEGFNLESNIIETKVFYYKIKEKFFLLNPTENFFYFNIQFYLNNISIIHFCLQFI